MAEPTQADTWLQRFITGKGTNPHDQMVDLQECWGCGWLQGCHKCAFRNRKGVGNWTGTCLVFTGDGRFGRRIKVFHRRGKKQTQEQYPGRW